MHALSEVGDQEMATRMEELQVKNISNPIGQPLSAVAQRLSAEAAVTVKNTFLCFEAICKLENRGTSSAPPTLCGVEGHEPPRLEEQAERTERCDSSVSSATVRTDLSKMWYLNYNLAHQKEPQPMISTGSPCSSQDSDAASSISAHSEARVKIGYTINNLAGRPSLARLTDVLAMQANQIPSVGSTHPRNVPCKACSFHFTHIHNPARRSPCKASYMCEFCHDNMSHNEQWHGRVRKTRRAPTVQVLSLPSLLPLDPHD